MKREIVIKRSQIKAHPMNHPISRIFEDLIYPFLILMLLVLSSCFLSAHSAEITNVGLYAKAGSGDYYTLYPDGLKKEDAYIGGFKSAQLDPLEENIYFFDTGLKVISKINLLSGKVTRVIGKPKSTTLVDYSMTVSFNDASLGKVKDFTFDKYGNIYILINNVPNDSVFLGKDTQPIILKASLKNNTITQVLDLEKTLNLNPNTKLSINGISYDNSKFIYIYGSAKLPDPNVSYFNPVIGQAIFRYDPITNAFETYGISETLSSLGFPYQVLISAQNIETLSIKGFAFDKSENCYLSTASTVNVSGSATTYPNINKVTPNVGNGLSSFISNGVSSKDDLGDGGQASSAYAVIEGAKCVCSDLNGDLLIADTANNRIRKVFNSNGLINTVVGGGSENLDFGQNKSAKSIALSSPSSLLVDKLNNLYVIEPNRILILNNAVSYVNQPIQIAKLATLSITKIAGSPVSNPKGSISTPDLSLDYSYAGNQTVEVTAKNIPEGTNVKLITTNADGTVSSDKPSAMLVNGVASVPVKIDAGTSKIVKAESDPFIPAPGVYLPGTEPVVPPGTLPEEPLNSAPKRSAVNSTTNLIPASQRFNFTNSGWKKFNQYVGSVSVPGIIDPDNNINDPTLIDFGNRLNPLYLDISNSLNNTVFSVWMRTDNESITIPIGIGPACPDRTQTSSFNSPGWEGCRYPDQLADGTRPPFYSYSSVIVTPQWQEFTISSIYPELKDKSKQIFIGGLSQPLNKKIYVWGAKLENY